jgi:hypothetical protein
MYEPLKHEGIFFKYESDEDLLYKEIFSSRPSDKCYVNLYLKGKFIGRPYVWEDSEMEGREYIEINHTVVYLDTLKTLVQVETLIAHICEVYNVTKQELRTDCRKRIYAEPRNILFYILREEYAITLEAIGDMFYRNHATVINGHKQVKGMMDVNPKYRDTITPLILTEINEKSELVLE